MTGTDANGDEADPAPRMSEWMKVMLDEMERKRAEYQEAQDELTRRRGDDDLGGDDAHRPGKPEDPTAPAR